MVGLKIKENLDIGSDDVPGHVRVLMLEQLESCKARCKMLNACCQSPNISYLMKQEHQKEISNLLIRMKAIAKKINIKLEV